MKTKIVTKAIEKMQDPLIQQYKKKISQEELAQVLIDAEDLIYYQMIYMWNKVQNITYIVVGKKYVYVIFYFAQKLYLWDSKDPSKAEDFFSKVREGEIFKKNMRVDKSFYKKIHDGKINLFGKMFNVDVIPDVITFDCIAEKISYEEFEKASKKQVPFLTLGAFLKEVIATG